MAEENRTPSGPLELNEASAAFSLHAKPILALGMLRGAFVCSRFSISQDRLSLVEPLFYSHPAQDSSAEAAGMALRQRLGELNHPPIRTALFVASGFSVRRFVDANMDDDKAWNIANRSWREAPPDVEPPEFRLAHCFLSPTRRHDEAIAISLPARSLREARQALLASGLPPADISPDPIAYFTLMQRQAPGTALAIRVPDEKSGAVTVFVIHEKHWLSEGA